ncbi:MAG: YceI family protein [Rubrivivax sp.]|nr:YceI family protein [Rubrivivax sp.]
MLDQGGVLQARARFDWRGRAQELTGEFTLRGTGVPLTLRAERVGCVDGPPRRCGGDFTGELRRSAFGADFGLPLVADRVVLKVQVEALPTRQ